MKLLRSVPIMELILYLAIHVSNPICKTSSSWMSKSGPEEKSRGVDGQGSSLCSSSVD
ncbi:hypothetical protein CK203_033551 [Vitis vinifera]|uniref:Uncharacterized protein n=1 Tax=Vitis vinifera TaxID=29760 RepID=A0A438FLF1_VITVI|nr:hypothetical protein CK203_033551 [Vitis vinifera]